MLGSQNAPRGLQVASFNQSINQSINQWKSQSISFYFGESP